MPLKIDSTEHFLQIKLSLFVKAETDEAAALTDRVWPSLWRTAF